VLLPRIESRLLPTLRLAGRRCRGEGHLSIDCDRHDRVDGDRLLALIRDGAVSATAYSPRLVLWFSRDPRLAHAFGTFTASVLYAIAALGKIDRSD
jgi:hypothetical protein